MDVAVTSYSHNQEDILLQKLLADVVDGFYLDVGAFLPVCDSNSYAFYRRGWSGIVIEPLAYHFHAEVAVHWMNKRPRDLLVRGMAADYNGMHDFYHCSMGQCSTGSSRIVSIWARHNNVGEPAKVPCWTLNYLLPRSKEIHFMSLDTEGMENDVLRGLDLKKHRPWVIVVENTVPGVMNKSDFDETLLIDYRKVHDDGVNGFYLADEHSGLWK